MDSCPEIWNVLHDATLVGATGLIPGKVSLEIECDHLRERFAEPGSHFVLTFDHCTTFQFRSWDDEISVVADLKLIAGSGLVILSADRAGELCKVQCTFTARSGGGILEIAAASATLQLDSGEPVQLGEIVSVAEAYWKEWSRRSIVQQRGKTRILPPQF
jgi:hypothetical protein